MNWCIFKIFSYHDDFSDANCFMVNFYFYFSGLPGYPEKVNNPWNITIIWYGLMHNYIQLQYLQIPCLNDSALVQSIRCCGKEFQILIASGKRNYCSSLDDIVAVLLPLVDEVFGLKIAGIIGISTCLFKILYNMIPLL